ncbi:hypothetical protein DL96DRAFT_308513 [Flagelloscypha sp. PMI_526]|nr:hypothetical protein DL96DRAFT_308513 [Flagelloscypha sp. PMI_526]
MAPLPTISLFTLLHLLLVALYFSLVSAEPQTHLVYVGVNGSFFSPSTVAAQANDVISFIFGADVHAVRQSTFEKPCTPLDGGFSSGLAGIKGVGFTGATGQPIPVWNLTVSNASRPLYFMCDSIDPVFHCSAGMVGIINSPNGTVHISLTALKCLDIWFF